MTRSQIVFLSVVFGIIFAIYFVMVNYTDSYKILPLDPTPDVPEPNYEAWHDFTSPKGHFSIMFPVLPHNATEKVLDPKTQQYRKYDMYVGEKPNGTIFMVSLITFIKEVEQDQKQLILTSIMDDMISSNPGNQLRASQIITFKNQQSLDFVIENEDVVIDGIVFLKEKTLYLLTRISKTDNQNLEEFQFFINSLQIHEKEEES